MAAIATNTPTKPYTKSIRVFKDENIPKGSGFCKVRIQQKGN